MIRFRGAYNSVCRAIIIECEKKKELAVTLHEKLLIRLYILRCMRSAMQCNAFRFRLFFRLFRLLF